MADKKNEELTNRLDVLAENCKAVEQHSTVYQTQRCVSLHIWRRKFKTGRPRASIQKCIYPPLPYFSPCLHLSNSITVDKQFTCEGLERFEFD